MAPRPRRPRPGADGELTPRWREEGGEARGGPTKERRGRGVRRGRVGEAASDSVGGGFGATWRRQGGAGAKQRGRGGSTGAPNEKDERGEGDPGAGLTEEEVGHREGEREKGGDEPDRKEDGDEPRLSGGRVETRERERWDRACPLGRLGLGAAGPKWPAGLPSLPLLFSINRK